MGWLWDDSLDRPGPEQADTERVADQLSAFRDALYGRPARRPETPLVATWRHLVQRLAARTSPTWQARHAAHWEECYAGFQQEARNNRAGRIPTLEEYLPLRRGASGMDICLDWEEAAGRYELPLNIHASKDLLALRQDCVDVVGMTNDLFSARREWADGNTDNIVHVLSAHNDCPWDEAVRGAENIINAMVERHIETEQRLLASDLYQSLSTAEQADVRRFTDAMKSWMRGSYDWHLTCPRYR
ncbi:hypothetical protein AB0I82_33895 [Streptomyces sp. NPDC050315]|uniref:terpene synthase family protein n=1 Tax=Streptomyces sp. NPDC050315 TaxID=3155039 RepID=UPI003423798D